MSQRDLNQSYVDRLRETEERLGKLESSKNTAIKRNDLRLTDTLVTADSPANRLCLENLETGEKVCLSEQVLEAPQQATWSFSGSLSTADNGTLTPPYNVERASTARQIVVARGYNDTFTGTVTVCVHFKNGSVILQASLPAASEYTTTEINVPLVEFDDIRVALSSAATGAENISVFVRFGTPTVAISTTNCGL